MDDTDREILRLLLADARRPYSDIAERVGLSAPAVSDRVDRLRDIGLIRRFTLDIDRTLLDEGVPALVTVDTRPGAGERVREQLATDDTVEYIFRTVDDQVIFTAMTPGGDIGDLIADTVEMDDIRDYEVRLLADSDWSPHIAGAELAPACDACGNTVTAEGERVTLDDSVHHFCCENCRDEFVDTYESLKEGA
jgi:DNA-binding Lrp family transcriptional regulator